MALFGSFWKQEEIQKKKDTENTQVILANPDCIQ